MSAVYPVSLPARDESRRPLSLKPMGPLHSFFFPTENPRSSHGRVRVLYAAPGAAPGTSSGFFGTVLAT